MLKKLFFVLLMSLFLIGSVNGAEPSSPSPYENPSEPEISKELKAEAEFVQYILQDVDSYLKNNPIEIQHKGSAGRYFQEYVDTMAAEIFGKKGITNEDYALSLFGKDDGKYTVPVFLRVMIKGKASPEIPVWVFDFPVKVEIPLEVKREKSI